MLVTYFTLIPSLLLAIISLSLLSIGIFTAQLILILIGTYMMFGEYEKEKAREKLVEEEKFTRKLQVLFEEFKDKIGSSAYVYSLPNASLRIAEDEMIRKRTEAWSLHLRSLVDNLTKEANLLDEKLKKGIRFSLAFEDFQNLLSLLRRIKDTFYIMFVEIKQVKDFTQVSDFQKIYRRCYSEFNNYMDRLSSFSDDLKAEFNLRLSKDSVKRLKDLNELYKS